VSYIMVDIEADGPIPGKYSMISLGSVVVEPGLTKLFTAKLRPISDNYLPDALAITGMTREETMSGEEPRVVLERYEEWLQSNSKGQPRFISDNNGFDWMFACWYFHQYLGRNPFGFSSTNLGSLYKGLVRSVHKNFKHLRKTTHTHDPVDDARGNAEALLYMKDQMQLDIDL
jgi:Exonuclease